MLRDHALYRQAYFLDLNSFIYWKSVLWLAYDDDPEIRSMCVVLCERLSQSPSMIPSRCSMPSLLGRGLGAVGLRRAAGEVLLAMMVVAYRTQENTEEQVLLLQNVCHIMHVFMFFVRLKQRSCQHHFTVSPF
jgi:hypothetical protein